MVRSALLPLLLALAGLSLTGALPFAGSVPSSNIWGVLVAGSNEYYNYRHQADVCHAYQVLHAHGVPDDHIVVMMFDDIANNDQNPRKGQLINHPNGSDVYAGVPKDYTGKLVTPTNLLKVLNGDAPEGGSGKVLNSGPDDYVFINYVDHGAPGILGFPFPQPDLTKKELLGALQKLSAAKKFKQLVLYVESCESGSMFSKSLPKNQNIYVTTASNPNESSYACYYVDELSTYVGDCYSVAWMENSDKSNLAKETLKEQFKKVKAEVNESHVMEYGQLDLAKDPVADFLGGAEAAPKELPKVSGDLRVPSPDVPVHILTHKLKKETDPGKKDKLAAELAELFQRRDQVRSLFASIVARSGHPAPAAMMETSRDVTELECHDAVVKHFSNVCLKTSQHPYTYRFVYVLVNLCEEGLGADKIKNALEAACEKLDVGLKSIV